MPRISFEKVNDLTREEECGGIEGAGLSLTHMNMGCFICSEVWVRVGVEHPNSSQPEPVSEHMKEAPVTSTIYCT